MATSVNRTASGGATTHVVADPYAREHAATREYTAPPSGRSVTAQVAAVLAVLAGVWVGSLLLGIWLIIMPFILAAKFAPARGNGFGGFAVILFALASLAGLRHRTTAR